MPLSACHGLNFFQDVMVDTGYNESSAPDKATLSHEAPGADNVAGLKARVDKLATKMKTVDRDPLVSCVLVGEPCDLTAVAALKARVEKLATKMLPPSAACTNVDTATKRVGRDKGESRKARAEILKNKIEATSKQVSSMSAATSPQSITSPISLTPPNMGRTHTGDLLKWGNRERREVLSKSPKKKNADLGKVRVHFVYVFAPV